MTIKEMKVLLSEAIRWLDGAVVQAGETPVQYSAEVSAQISIAKSLTVIAAVMVGEKERQDFREEVEGMPQERLSRR